MDTPKPEVPDEISDLSDKQEDTVAQLQTLAHSGRRGIQPDMERMRGLRRGYLRREAVLTVWENEQTTVN